MVDNQQDAALALIWLFPAITTVLVALRIWSRYLGRNFGWGKLLSLLSCPSVYRVLYSVIFD